MLDIFMTVTIKALFTGAMTFVLWTAVYLAGAFVWQIWQARKRPTRAPETQDDFTAALARASDRMTRMDQ